jgi:hypothetical protein
MGLKEQSFLRLGKKELREIIQTLSVSNSWSSFLSLGLKEQVFLHLGQDREKVSSNPLRKINVKNNNNKIMLSCKIVTVQKLMCQSFRKSIKSLKTSILHYSIDYIYIYILLI